MSDAIFRDTLRPSNDETNGLYSRRVNLLQEKIDAHPVEIVLWEATRLCNLRCIHCGTPADHIDRKSELSKEEVLQVFAQIRDDFDIRTIKYVSITGGEPTSREDLLEIIPEIVKMGFTEIAMHSNGHKISEVPGYLDALVSAGIRGIGINLDGLEDTHNKIRNHRNSFNIAKKASSMIIQHGGVADTMISTVVTKENLNELEKLRDIIFELNPYRWRLIPLEPIGRVMQQMQDSILDNESMDRLVEFVLETRAMAEENTILPKAELACGQWYGKELEGMVRPYIWHCIAGINTLGILYNGNIAACTNINPDIFEGNVRTDRIRDVWDNRYKRFRQFEWKRNGECVDCDDWDLCHGGDMHRRLPDGTMIGKCYYRWIEKRDKSLT
jgi:radical SAM protein with 4Fe4S-binding SPASM domain